MTNSFLLSLTVVITGAAITVWVGGPFVARIAQPYADQLDDDAGLVEGGRIIGYAERLLIYVFVLADAPSAIGIAIRFGERVVLLYRKRGALAAPSAVTAAAVM